MSSTAQLPDEIAVFASDETVKVYLSKTQWVELKTELTYGERKRLDLAMFKGWKQAESGSDAREGMGVVDLAYQTALKSALYVVDWNLVNRAGKRLVIPDGLTQRITFFEGLGERMGEAISNEIDRIQARIVAGDQDEDAPGNVVEGQTQTLTAVFENGSEPETAPTYMSASTPAGAGTS